MELTKEQVDIINSTGNIKINAVAGSGKTTTIIEYAKTRSKESKILYLVFNKSVKLEAAKKFKDLGLDNVKVESAHSLAYKNVVFKYNYKVRAQSYKTNEISQILKLQGTGEKHVEFVIASHINKFISYFCNSDKRQIQDLNYLDLVTGKAKTFVRACYGYIENQTRLLLSKMDKAEIDITHDFYLKKFQLAEPNLNYDYILFDEGQDASPAMLDVFLKQKATKIIVGDVHQQIYGWRFAVNAMEKAEFKIFHLSTSFRFSQDVADLAIEILKFKGNTNGDQPISITGKGDGRKFKTKAIIARTNLGLLLKAIEYVTEKKDIKSIYFEGNINSYTYAEEGASLYDVLNLSNGKHRLIRDELIRGMKDLNELQEYIDKTEDVQLGMMVEIVREYGSEIPGIIRAIKEKHVDDKEKAEMIFSTVHRCKGMEYDAIQLVNDFIPFEKLLKNKEKAGRADGNAAKLNEEINLLYVAITRTKNSIHIPEPMMPNTFPDSDRIHILNVENIETSEAREEISVAQKTGVATKTYSVEDIRKKHGDAYKPWTEELDKELVRMFSEGIIVKDMMKHFGRSRGAISSRIAKLELKELGEG